MKNRLEQIKSKIKANVGGIYETALSKSDEEWLIEQAETLEKIEMVLDELYESNEDEGMDLCDLGERVMNIFEGD